MSTLRLDFACWDYDRIRPLTDGTVTAKGIELNWLNTPVEETFWRMNRYEHFQVSEFSFMSYLMGRDRGHPKFTAIPVFISRLFRHSSIYVNKNAGIKEPRDLQGKRVGTPEYHVTANVWIRGLLQHDYGVRPSELKWFTGGQDKPGRITIMDYELPKEIDIRPIGAGQTLNEMLEAGELDAVIGPRAPANFHKPGSNIVRLFPDHVPLEQQYFRRTGIFPIMHIIVIKDEVLQRHPWVAANLYQAFSKAKDIVYRGLNQVSALKVTAPWIASSIEDTKRLMGDDFWPYGVDKNRPTLEALVTYAHEQGLIRSKPEIADLFDKSSIVMSREINNYE